MGRLTRRIALWGGAAAVASGGFAFMASGAATPSRAGVSQGSISGYYVHTQHFIQEMTTGVPGEAIIKGLILKLTPTNAAHVSVWFSNSAGAREGAFYACAKLSSGVTVPIDQWYPTAGTATGYWSCGGSPYGGGLNGGGTFANPAKTTTPAPMLDATNIHIAASQ